MVILRDKILNIEKKYGLYEDKIEGINYWIYARFEMFHSYLCGLQEKFEGEMCAPLPNKRSVIKKIPGLLYNMFFMGIIKAKHVDICIIPHERRIWENERFECKYSRELYKYFEGNCIYLERPYNFAHLKPIAEKNIVYLDYIFILSRLYYWYIRLFRRKRYQETCHQVKRHIKAPFVEIASCYGVEYQLQDVSERITQLIFQNKVRKYQVRKLLRRIRPKVIIEVVGYEHTCMAVNEVAHEMGIPTYELQHGTVYESHFAYNYADGERILQFPDYVLLFGDIWKSDIKWPVESDHIISVGFPYLEEKKAQLRKTESQGQKKIILILSQVPGGKELSKLACELQRLIAEKQLNAQIIYKLHPCEYLVWKQKYPELYTMSQSSNLNVIDTSKSDLYQLLCQADIQIGIYSTVIMEGLSWGLSTFIYLKEETNSKIKYLCDNNMAHYADCAEDIAEFLTNDSAVDKIETDYFWKEDSINNIIKVIQEAIIENNDQ